MKHSYFYSALLFLVLFLPWVGNLHAQNSAFAASQKLDEYLDRELKKFDIPNLELLLINSQGIVYSRSIGEGGGMDRPYYIGSVSKSLTAMGIMTLVDQGSLRLEDTLQKLIPSIQIRGFEQSITIKHLLSHTSGISKREGFYPIPSLAEVKEQTLAIYSQRRAGTKHEYSNLNYALLGLVIEAQTGLSFSSYMQKAVFEPLGMKHSYATPVLGEKEALLPQYQYYFGFPFKSEQADFDPSVVPAGFIRSSAQDLGLYVQAQIKGQNQVGDSILSDQALQLMQTPWNGDTYGYGMGWKKGNIHQKNFVQHLGTTATSYSGIFLFPEDSLGIVFLTNSNSSSFSEELLTGILDIAAGKEGRSCSQQEKYIGWGVGIFLLLVIGQFLLKSPKAIQGKVAGTKAQKIRNLVLYILAIIAFIAAFPFVFNIPFVSFLQLKPDIGIPVLISVGLSFVLSIIQILAHKDEGNE